MIARSFIWSYRSLILFSFFFSVCFLFIIQTRSFLLPYLLIYICFLCSLHSKIAICFFLISSVSLLRLFIFFCLVSFFFICFKHMHNCSLKHFLMATLKSLSDNANISVFSVLVFPDYLFPFSLTFSWFLV